MLAVRHRLFAASIAALISVPLALLAAGCGHAPTHHVSWPDAPPALRDETDRDEAIDRLWVMTPGAARDHARADVAAAIARRLEDALEEDLPLVAATLLDQLTWLWQPDPANVGAGLAAHADLLRRLRAMFAKAGALEPTVQTLVLLAELEPAHRAAYLAELDEVLAFADELAISDNGPTATRSQQLALLQPTALGLPLPWLVDRYLALMTERQRAISALIDQQGASIQLVRAHHDVLSTSRRIANVLARAGRIEELHRHLARIKGLGADRELAARAEVLAEHPTADAYAELASALRVDEHTPDAAAALATCLAGLAKFPGDVGLLLAGAGDARTLGRIDQAIALYEQALHTTPEVDTSAALRLGKLYGERIARLAAGGRPTAATEAWHGVLAFTSASARQHPHSVWQQAAAIAESALGRGLASQGLVDDARHALAASLERAPSIDAYETLTTIALQTDELATAERWAKSGLAMLGDQSSGDRYRRAKLERIAGDALRRSSGVKVGTSAGDKTRMQAAAARYLDALRSWASLGEDKELPRTIAAERKLDAGRAMWWLGDLNPAVDLVMRAVDTDPDTAEIPSNAVAFLLEGDRYRDALDVYHRGLGASIGDSPKIYMSLWIAGEARRRGEALDRLASDYLASRQGDTWYELLARAATGRLPYATLLAAATTGPRRAELAFYTATLGLDPAAATPEGRKRLFSQVVAAGVVLDAEYDLARWYLALP